MNDKFKCCTQGSSQMQYQLILSSFHKKQERLFAGWGMKSYI